MCGCVVVWDVGLRLDKEEETSEYIKKNRSLFEVGYCYYSDVPPTLSLNCSSPYKN